MPSRNELGIRSPWPDGKTWTYGYDANGYRNSSTDPLGDQAAVTFCEREGIVIARAASEGMNPAGGYLVPDEVGTAIVDRPYGGR